jgi:hypothetical protein
MGLGILIQIRVGEQDPSTRVLPDPLPRLRRKLAQLRAANQALLTATQGCAALSWDPTIRRRLSVRHASIP